MLAFIKTWLALPCLSIDRLFFFFPFKERQYSNVEEIRTALEEGEIQGALLDTYVAAEHKESLLGGRVFVKKILDRPFGYGVVLSGAARNVEQRCRDYINMKISDIFIIIQNMTKTLDVSHINFPQTNLPAYAYIIFKIV